MCTNLIISLVDDFSRNRIIWTMNITHFTKVPMLALFKFKVRSLMTNSYPLNIILNIKLTPVVAFDNLSMCISIDL